MDAEPDRLMVQTYPSRSIPSRVGPLCRHGRERPDEQPALGACCRREIVRLKPALPSADRVAATFSSIVMLWTGNWMSWWLRSR